MKAQEAQLRQRKEKAAENCLLMERQCEIVRREHNRLQQSNLKKTELFRNISENIRVPVTVLNNKLSELMNDQVKEERFGQATSTLSAMMSSISLLLENLLQWSKYQTYEYPFQLRHVKTSGIVNDAINQQKFSAAEKNIALCNMLENDATMYADKDMTVSVLKTILQNTISLMDKNGSITFSGDKQPLLICVKGSIPMKELYIKLLHTESYDNGCPEVEKSIKLGWMFCRSVAERHNSRIDISEISADTLGIQIFAPIAN
ncbi:MAG: hypothetical protein LBS09_02680 [Bacteroidales bacterium]|nr:hypothetical protein [Bacteroidales bacterium]